MSESSVIGYLSGGQCATLLPLSGTKGWGSGSATLITSPACPLSFSTYRNLSKYKQFPHEISRSIYPSDALLCVSDRPHFLLSVTETAFNYSCFSSGVNYGGTELDMGAVSSYFGRLCGKQAQAGEMRRFQHEIKLRTGVDDLGVINGSMRSHFLFMCRKWISSKAPPPQLILEVL